MPSVSQKEQMATAIAEHQPGKLYKRNRGLLKMSHAQLHDFAATPRSDLPVKAKGNLSEAARKRGQNDGR